MFCLFCCAFTLSMLSTSNMWCIQMKNFIRNGRFDLYLLDFMCLFMFPLLQTFLECVSLQHNVLPSQLANHGNWHHSVADQHVLKAQTMRKDIFLHFEIRTDARGEYFRKIRHNLVFSYFPFQFVGIGWRLWSIANCQWSLQIGLRQDQQIGSIPILLSEIRLRSRCKTRIPRNQNRRASSKTINCRFEVCTRNKWNNIEHTHTHHHLKFWVFFINCINTTWQAQRKRVHGYCADYSVFMFIILFFRQTNTFFSLANEQNKFTWLRHSTWNRKIVTNLLGFLANFEW